MSKIFSESERKINSLFNSKEHFTFNQKKYDIIKSGKPYCNYGEPKTDVYVLAKDSHDKILELKISVKQSNAEFMENKMSAQRAEEIFGIEWKEILQNSINRIRSNFENDFLIYFKAGNRTERGAIKLGWKFEIFSTPQGKLSDKIQLDKTYFKEVLAGYNLSEAKKNSCVGKEKITDCGIANYIFEIPKDNNIVSIQYVIDNLIDIHTYAETHDYYFGCKALNYRVFKTSPGLKWDGNRPLAVYIEWAIENHRLKSNIILDEPLMKCGNEIGNNLSTLLQKLKISPDNFDTFSELVHDKSKCYI